MSFKDAASSALGSIFFLILIPLLEFFLGLSCYIRLLPESYLITALGVAVAILGVFLTLRSLFELAAKGKGGPFVIGPLQLSTETSSLVTTGPYALCRNPMHLGLLFLYLGEAVAVNSLSCAIIPLCMWIFAWLFAVCLDEPRLKRDFGKEYMQWACQVPRFWPRIKNIKRRQENKT